MARTEVQVVLKCRFWCQQGCPHETFLEQLTHPMTRKVDVMALRVFICRIGQREYGHGAGVSVGCHVLPEAPVALLGLDLLSALVTRLQERFRAHVGTVLPSLIDRLGDSKDQVRDQDQTVLLKIMEQAASPQVRDGAMSCLVEIYRHVGERVRMDLCKKGLPQSRLNVIFGKFDEVQRSGNMMSSSCSAAFCCITKLDGSSPPGSAVQLEPKETQMSTCGPRALHEADWLMQRPGRGSEATSPGGVAAELDDITSAWMVQLTSSSTGYGLRRQEAEGRRQEAGGRRQEAGGIAKEARPMRSAFEAGDREKEARPLGRMPDLGQSGGEVGGTSSSLSSGYNNVSVEVSATQSICSAASDDITEILYEDKNFEDEDSVDGGRSSSSSSKAPPSGRRPVVSSVRRPSTATTTKVSAKDAAAGAVDEDDFIKTFEDVPSVQIYSNRELEDQLSKIREVLSDEKHDWEHRVVALKKVRSLLLAGATEYEGFPQQLRLLEAPLKLSAKDLRSQVVREACITLGHLSSILGIKFDHGAESIMPTLLSLVPNSAKVMATSGVATIRLILRRTHYPRLIPIIASNCIVKSVAVRRRSFEFLDLMLQEWHTNTLERHVAVLTDTIKKGIHDADSEARSIARKCYWGFHGHYSREAEHLFQALESTYQKALQSHLKGSDSILSLPPSDRSSSSSQESLNRPLSVKSVIGGSITRSKLAGSRVSTTSLQRSRSDVDVNAASSAKCRLTTVPASSPFGSAAALPPGSYASLGRVRTRRQSSGSVGGASTMVVDNRGRSRAKVVSQSQRTYTHAHAHTHTHTHAHTHTHTHNPCT
ncbi:CLIP-associating protein 1 [Liparis tanakae]|uniref:CLIP-associating protein 1 n=1 Tax=Liparis tanakae TaxID=230148 RepID=A0A4Z2GAF3_9TELE|nr:CLIP-associating protein 1 [Liparis tanakae]